jgi:hypothetical protein
MGCEVHLLKIIHILKVRKKKKISSWTAFFDLKKAYDSVNHRILLEKLAKHIDVNSPEFKMIAWILSSTKIKYKENQDDINVNAGVP